MNASSGGNVAEQAHGGPLLRSHGKRFIMITALLAAAAFGLLLQLVPPKSLAPTVLGQREYASTIAGPEEITFFQTTAFVAKLTNGPPPESLAKVGPGISLPKAAVERLRRILTDPESFDEFKGDTAPLMPDIVLTFRRHDKSVNLAFSDDLKMVSVRADGKFRMLNCEPARHDFERVLGPFLTNRPNSWHVD
jgi:hypothetical protein